jgi:hypothetical protein
MDLWMDGALFDSGVVSAYIIRVLSRGWGEGSIEDFWPKGAKKMRKRGEKGDY